MDSKKTVAERLREYVGEDQGSCSRIARAVGLNCMEVSGCFACADAVLNRIADMIEAEQTERTKAEHDGVDVDALLKVADELDISKDCHSLYMDKASAHRKRDIIRNAVKGAKPQLPEGIEWPRFEDGELVKFGDEFVSWDGETHKVRGVEIFGPESGPDYAINPGYSHNFVGGKKDSHGEFVKRPKPKVLDADGVPIKVGDTVWFWGKEWNVNYIYAYNDSEAGINLSSFVKDEFGEPVEGIAGVLNKDLTHRKPDTQEGIDADAAKTACLYFNPTNPYKCSECPKGNGSDDVDYQECCTEQKRDLLERQRKLMGGE